MGIVKISDLMHENLRVAGNALSRSINAQAEHWMRVGMLTEMHPELNHREICQLLIDAGAHVEDCNKDGVQPLQLAVAAGHAAGCPPAAAPRSRHHSRAAPAATVSGQGREHRSEERARSGAPRGSEPWEP